MIGKKVKYNNNILEIEAITKDFVNQIYKYKLKNLNELLFSEDFEEKVEDIVEEINDIIIKNEIKDIENIIESKPKKLKK